MNGKLYIDGLDAFTAYGVFVQNGGYANLVQWPALKSVDTNDWPEDDGVDADLSDPKLASNEFQMSFCCVDYEKTILLFQTLTDGAYHTFDFSEIGITKELRLVSQPGTNMIKPLQIFSLQLADDEYLKDYDRQGPVRLTSETVGLEIDGVDLSEYGVRILSGTLDSILKAPAVKKNMSIDTDTNSGVIYENTNVSFQAKDVTLKCFLRTPSTEVFWGNYHALFFDLIQPHERMLHITEDSEYYSCYYKSAKVSRFAKGPDGNIWCEFDVSLCFVSARPGQLEYFLSTEDDSFVMTEDSDNVFNVFIDMAYEN